MAVAEINNLVIEKGTDFSTEFSLFESDNSAAVLTSLGTAYATIRKHPTATSYKNFSLTITAGTGKVKMSMTAADTSELIAGRNYFDVVLTIGGLKTKIIKGTILVEESVSV
jgi:hypothetical protein